MLSSPYTSDGTLKPNDSVKSNYGRTPSNVCFLVNLFSAFLMFIILDKHEMCFLVSSVCPSCMN